MKRCAANSSYPRSTEKPPNQASPLFPPPIIRRQRKQFLERESGRRRRKPENVPSVPFATLGNPRGETFGAGGRVVFGL